MYQVAKADSNGRNGGDGDCHNCGDDHNDSGDGYGHSGIECGGNEVGHGGNDDNIRASVKSSNICL